MDTFHYNSLDLEGPSFRLLRLLSGNGHEIECEIFEAILHGDDTIPFEALSYVWGSLDTPRTIKLNGKRLAITENLSDALQNLRVEDEDRFLWVDAICIDQKNEKERGHQVQQMGDIFSQAEQVIFWLGHATSDTNLVLTALRRLERQAQKQSSGNWLPSDERWLRLWSDLQPQRKGAMHGKQKQGLEELLQRPWFRRVWILQEVARARRAVVCAGNKLVGSRMFALAPMLIDVQPDTHCQAVLDIMPGLSRNNSWWSQKRDLYTLLQRFSHSQASDPRDMIYALLGISSGKANAYNLRPDYTKSTEQVIDDTTSILFSLPPCPFRTMDEFLKNLSFLTAKAFLAIARSGDATDMFNFLEDRGNQISIGTTELMQQQQTSNFGADIMEILLMQPGIFVTASVIARAIQNTECGPDILRLLDKHGNPKVRKLVEDLVAEAAAPDSDRGQMFHGSSSEPDDSGFD